MEYPKKYLNTWGNLMEKAHGISMAPSDGRHGHCDASCGLGVAQAPQELLAQQHLAGAVYICYLQHESYHVISI